MNRLLLFLIVLLLVSASCRRADTEKVRVASQLQDSASPLNDFILEDKDSTEWYRLDSSRRDSILNIQAEEQYKHGVVINAGKKIYTYIGDGTVAGKFSRKCEIINNTFVTLYPGDYQVFYKYDDLDTEDGELVPVTKTGYKKGQKLLPGESYNTTISIIGDDLSAPTVKLKLSKKEFIKRFKEQTIFDESSNEFKPR